MSFQNLQSSWLRHKTSENLFFLNFGRPDWRLVKTLLEWPASEPALKQFSAFKQKQSFFKIMWSCKSLSAKTLARIPEAAT